MSMGAPLYALIAAIKRSPIVVRLSERLLLARDWASVRKSPDVDAYVLAWIASQRRRSRCVRREPLGAKHRLYEQRLWDFH
jgi:hypothetical protein